MIKKIVKLLLVFQTPIPFIIKDISEKYNSHRYSNLIEVLYESNLEGPELSHKIRKMCKTGRTNFQMLKFVVKDNFKMMDGSLTCRLCGRNDLIDVQEIESNPEDKFNILRTEMKDRVATIEHINPISKGGLKYDPSNMTITCYNCNCNRGVKEIKKIDHFHYQFV